MIGQQKIKYALAADVLPPVTDDGRMCAKFVVTSEREDREGDIVLTKGGDWTEHRRNPVALFNHQSDALPIGKWEDPDGRYTIEPRPELGKSYGTCWFTQATPMGQQCYELTKSGILRAASIGFIVRKAESRGQKGPSGRPPLLIQEWQPTEISVVTIGCNPDAIREQLERSLVAGSPLHPHIRKGLESMAAPLKVWANGWKGFDPNEPRDAGGKWTSAGGTSRASALVDKYEKAPDGGGLKEKGGVYDEWRRQLAKDIAGYPTPDGWDKPEIEHDSWSTYIKWEKTFEDKDGDEQTVQVKVRLSQHDSKNPKGDMHDIESQLGRRDGEHIDPTGEKLFAKLPDIFAKRESEIAKEQGKESKSMGQSIQSVFLKSDAFPTIDAAKQWLADEQYAVPDDAAVTTTDEGHRIDFYPADRMRKGSSFDVSLGDGKAVGTFGIEAEEIAVPVVPEIDAVAVVKSTVTPAAPPAPLNPDHAALAARCKIAMRDVEDWLGEHAASPHLNKSESAAAKLHKGTLSALLSELGELTPAKASAIGGELKKAVEVITDDDPGDMDDADDDESPIVTIVPELSEAEQKRLGEMATKTADLIARLQKAANR